ncbi:hypothetical protein [Pantoea sp. SS70]|uniref:hypothetical protein n=1 Tax=Pantoea sp. SS70 TaxID=3024247 RepID=UPI0024533AA3|nr:hypothetical protein [Pantoea sp. SS70]WGK60045.1 hypothetical protein PO881_23145 [Pantoea sp. SS70]
MLNEINKKILHDMVARSRSPVIIKFSNIREQKARNIMRGVNPTSSTSIKNGLEKLKLSCSDEDYNNAVLMVKTDPIFSGNEFGQLFNIKCPRPLKFPIKFSIEKIERQININEDRIQDIIDLAGDIMIELKKGSFNRALDKCNELKECEGVSIFLIRVISYIVNRYQLLQVGDTEILSKIDRLKSEIEISKSQFIWEVVSQLSNLRTSHIAICKRINELDENIQNGLIAKFFIDPIPKSQEEYVKTVNAFFSFSVLDAYLYISVIQSLNVEYIEDSSINKELKQKISVFSEIEFHPDEMYEKMDEDSSYYFLRECFLFIEQKKAFRFLSIHGYYYSYYNSQKVLPLFQRKLINDYFADVKNLTDLRSFPCDNIIIAWDIYNGKSCGMLENSSALVHLITKKEGILTQDEQNDFVNLMTYTRDIGEICHPDYLDNIAFNAKDDLVKLVAQCLIAIHKKKQYAEHDLRSTIQEYCISHFGGDLIKMMEHLYSVSQAVTEHLMMTCNENFLSKLFHLMDKPVDALQLRADLLEWFGNLKSDSRYIDRAKTLRVDIQINKEKGTIDDSRIYVDPLKYSQWFEDSMISKFSMDLDNFIISNSNNLNLENFSKGKTIGPWDGIIEHILSCYREFCGNKAFGIASYLGRRIRHGTFKGTAESGMLEFARDKQYISLFEDKDFTNKYNLWLNEYFSMVDLLVKDSLQIKNKKKPNGLIRTDIDDQLKKKFAQQLVNEILAVYSKETGVILLPGIILEYCWRMVEIDLADVRKLLSEKKSSYGVFSYSTKAADVQTKRLCSKFIQEVNSSITQKFRLISSWFNKPSYASPSTDIYLLFNAVISEVKDRVPTFRPELDIGDKSFSVNGGAYYVIYDAISVLIYNAAHHGKKDGKIFFMVNYDEPNDSIRISLKTEVSSSDDLEHAKTKIESAISNSDEDAYIIENNSGIKKLKKLEKEGSISDVRFNVLKDSLLLCFNFTFKLNTRVK